MRRGQLTFWSDNEEDRHICYLFIEQVRTTVADFAVFLSVTTWTLVDYMIGVDTPKLNVPADFKPTRSDRFSDVIL